MENAKQHTAQIIDARPLFAKRMTRVLQGRMSAANRDYDHEMELIVTIRSAKTPLKTNQVGVGHD